MKKTEKYSYEFFLSIKKLMKEKAFRNIPFSFQEAYALGAYASQACRALATKKYEAFVVKKDDRQKVYPASPSWKLVNNPELFAQIAQVQSVLLLCSLHNKALYQHKDAYKQIAGISAGIIDYDMKRPEGFGFLKPKVPYVVDNCGMGGDHFVTANVSTLSAIVASSLGVYMCKHGSPSNSDGGRCGSSDFVEFCGIHPQLPINEIEKMIEEHRFGYTEALEEGFKLIHTQTHAFAHVSHMNDIIGPLTHPVDPTLLKYKIVGVNHLISTETTMKALRLMNEKGYTHFEKALAVRGYVGSRKDDGNGIDELSLSGYGTDVSELHEDGHITNYKLFPKDFGIKALEKELIGPPPRMGKQLFSMSILKNEVDTVERTYMIAAGTALILHLVGKVDTLTEGFGRALEEITSGNAWRHLQLMQGKCVT